MCQPCWNAISGIMSSYLCLYGMVFLVPGISLIIMTVNSLVSAGFYGMYMALGVAGIVACLIFSIVYFKLSSSFREVHHLLKCTL